MNTQALVNTSAHTDDLRIHACSLCTTYQRLLFLVPRRASTARSSNNARQRGYQYQYRRAEAHEQSETCEPVLRTSWEENAGHKHDYRCVLGEPFFCLPF
jgi:hypothetical protein